MDSYIEVIKIAVLVFPFIALLLSIPFILIAYHKYGSISFYKSLIIYSFVLYLTCAYFLVILPLPKISEVALLTTPRTQLIPFSFIIDFIKNTSLDITNVHTYIKAMKEMYFYVPLYNIFLTLPFGIYLRYYFKCDLKKTCLYSFLLSLFFELTQLSGLYFIYPRGYRLFDVDDLILNTFGGLVGFFTAKPFMKILPSRDKVDEQAKEKGKIISGFRRTTSFCLDFFLFLIITLILELLSLFTNSFYNFGIAIFIYYYLIPSFLKCSTLGEKFLNIKVVDTKDKENLPLLYLRNSLFIILYILLPILISYLIFNFSINDFYREINGLIYILILFIWYATTGIKYLFTNKRMLYEKLSKTKLISTIKQNENIDFEEQI